jgi:hypothetical protein
LARTRMRLTLTAAAMALAAGLPTSWVLAEMRPTPNLSGVAGLIDMPSGEAMPDGTFSLSVGNFGPVTRSTLSFQITPWLGGSYRIQYIRNWNADGYDTYDDRSFDLRLRLLEESTYLPALSLGLQDIAGTGLFASEYIAATKTFGDRLKVTGGIGWGRLGSYNSFGSPFGDRPPIVLGEGGEPNPGTWFKGPAAAFGGLEYRINDNWTFKAEYSSDNYDLEDGVRGTFERESPFNFGIEYQKGPNLRFGAYSLYGSEYGIGFHVILDPKQRMTVGILGDAPEPVKPRPSRAADPESYDQGWVTQPDAVDVLRKNLARRLAIDGMVIEDFAYTATSVDLRVRNTKIDSGAQAVGRAARALSHVMPASVETFHITPVVQGMGVSRVTMRRSDIEALEHVAGNDIALRDRLQVGDAWPAPANGSGPDPELYPRLTWRLLPAFHITDPLEGDIGLRFSASYEMRPGLVLSGQLYQRLAENFDDLPTTDSNLPPVRSDVEEYLLDGDTAMERLTLAWYAHPAENIYTRVTLGYLERMHAGVSGEVLWQRPNSPLALGVEVNFSAQRDTDGGFGFSQYDYRVATGHVSAYYDFGNGYLGQVDVGRYLAGDYGATLSFDRQFGNGWKVGAFASFTSASFEEYGEGSFTKGFRVSIPLSWVLGQPTRQEVGKVITPIQRDGGARLDVDGRLYDTIRGDYLDLNADEWGRLWR